MPLGSSVMASADKLLGSDRMAGKEPQRAVQVNKLQRNQIVFHMTKSLCAALVLLGQFGAKKHIHVPRL